MSGKPLENLLNISKNIGAVIQYMILEKNVHFIPEKNLKILKVPCLATITVGQSSMQFFPRLLFNNYYILRNDVSISSLNNLKRLHRLKCLKLSLIF